MDRERFPCPNCGHDSSLERGHRGPASDAAWLCAEFARARFECGCDLDFGSCPKHTAIKRGLHEVIMGNRLAQRVELSIYEMVGMPRDHFDWSFIRDADPAILEQCGQLAGIAA